MKGIILAAGRGSRMKTLTDERPKCLVELDGRPLLDYQINALSDAAAWPRLRVLRREILTELADLAQARGNLSPSVDGLVERLEWRHPLRPEGLMREAVGATLAAAELIGVTGRGILSPAGIALLRAGREEGGDDEAILAAVAAQLPEPVDHVLLQADLTAVVPGPPGPHLGALLRVAAEQESRGGASVYRFTTDRRIILLTTFRKQRDNERDEVTRARRTAAKCAIDYP